MPDRGDDEASASSASSTTRPLPRRSLPPLVVGSSRSNAARDSARPPRLSHRSRAGCWTCRGRKVKCDEIHPVCGPCKRLERECDWDHRWSFADSTISTQGKYTNVSTTGNAVWDPTVTNPTRLSSSTSHDDLPEFAALVTDDDRERKAKTQRPGTFSVVVTPESFSDLPEYASGNTSVETRRRSSFPAHRGSFGGTRPYSTRTTPLIDPNVIFLDKFEDTPPTPSTQTTATSTSSRHDSYAEGIQRLSVSSPSSINFSSNNIQPSPLGPDPFSIDHLLTHFRHYIVPRLVQPQQTGLVDAISQGSTINALELESRRFKPLHHAICAISALNLAYTGHSSLEKALQHYHQALAAQTHPTTPTDLLSDGVFFRHFLLFIYDICVPMQADEDGGADMWAEHLNHLRRISLTRHAERGTEPYAYTLWTICELDMYACLLGSGNCEFVRTIMRHNMLPTPEQQIPSLSPTLTNELGAFLPNEIYTFPAILNLNQGIVIHTCKLAQTAQACRMEAVSRGPISAEAFARWQASATQIQAEMRAFWTQTYPQFLGPESPTAGRHLPERVCYMFENALLLYHAAVLYARTSLFPGQRRIPVASQADISADSERRVAAILAVAAFRTQQAGAGAGGAALARRHAVFPLFVAGVVSLRPAAKAHALELIRALEGSGIGQNTARTRQLLAAVCDDQTRRVRAGGRMEDTDWLVVAKESGLAVVNCGL